jgi:hypothetical protein
MRREDGPERDEGPAVTGPSESVEVNVTGRARLPPGSSLPILPAGAGAVEESRAASWPGCHSTQFRRDLAVLRLALAST